MFWKKNWVLMGMGMALLAGCGEPPLMIVGQDPTENPLTGLTASEQAAFDRGDVLFERSHTAAEGLGPVYIRNACTSCHAGDARGPALVTRMVVMQSDGMTPSPDQSLLPFGSVERPLYTMPAQRGVTVPTGVSNLRTSVRLGPAVFGRGWMEAIAESEIERVAREQQQQGGMVHGRVPRLMDGRVGRFGLKGRVATLEEFAADAARGDMGLTNSYFPNEVLNPDQLTDDTKPGLDLSDEVIRDLGAYVRMLAIPKREGLTAQGASVFASVGCATCHTPSMQTRSDALVGVLANKQAEVFTDMLLHDMGQGLADGIAEGAAGPRDWRTPPLMGLRHARGLMHDGRASTVEEAIRAHRSTGSEANGSVDQFEALSAEQQRVLLDYVGRL